MKEVIKIIPDFPNYGISNKGYVLNLHRNTILKLRVYNRGYYMVILYKDGVRYKKQVSRLVAKAFIPNPLKNPLVMHLDNNRLNNNSKNLAWGIQQENIAQAVRDGRIAKAEKLPQTKISITDCVKIVQSKDTQKNIANKFGICKRLIRFIKAGKTHNAQEAIKLLK